MNNSVFGKSIEKARKTYDMRLIKTETELRKIANKPNFKNINKMIL